MTSSLTSQSQSANPLSRQPRVSVGLPVFNGARYLERCLKSILGQTFHDFDLVISDNASQDETPAICEQLAARDSRVRYIRNSRNIGIMENFAAVAREARGELFAWIGSDDLWEPDFLNMLVGALDANPTAGLACANYDWIDDADNYARPGSIQLARWMPGFLAHYLAFGAANSRLGSICLYWWWRNPFPIYGLFRRANLLQLLPFEYLFSDCRHADNLLLLRFLFNWNIVVADRVLFHYRLKERDTAAPNSSYYTAGARVNSAVVPATPMTDERVLLGRVSRVARESTLSPPERAILRLALPAISRLRRGWLWTQSHFRGLP
jgi:glycosyltransferase involved in cell wall biosynthesis